MLTQKEMEKYIKGWEKRKNKKEKELSQKRKKAIKKAHTIGKKLKEIYNVDKVVLFGSIVEDKFWGHSDIDIAIKDIKEENYLEVYNEMLEIAFPFKLDLILLEKAPASLKKKIKNKGVEI